MLGSTSIALKSVGPCFLAQAAPPSPLLIFILSAVAGVGTVLLLPSRREAPIRQIGLVILLASGLIFAALLLRVTAGSAEGGMGFYFWTFSAIALIGAVRVITHPKPVYSALYFVLTVFATAGLFLLLWAEFMAAALILIYAGAILVTYVFVIMLAAEAMPAGASSSLTDHDSISRDPVSAAAIGFAMMGVILFVIFDKAQTLRLHSTPDPVTMLMPQLNATEITSEVFTVPTTQSNSWDFQSPGAVSPVVSGSTQELGVFLFQKHLVSVELAGLILTVSMIGAIVIARRRVIGDASLESSAEMIIAPATPINDDPHSIPVTGTRNPRQKAYPEH